MAAAQLNGETTRKDKKQERAGNGSRRKKKQLPCARKNPEKEESHTFVRNATARGCSSCSLCCCSNQAHFPALLSPRRWIENRERSLSAEL